MAMKSIISVAIVLAMAQGATTFAQAAAQQNVPQNTQAPAPQSAPAAPPLHLNTIGPPPKLQFPPANPKNFTASSPTTQVVNAFLKQIWGYDPNRAWQVMGIQTTQVPGISRVTILVGEQGVSHTPAPTVFFVTPDGHHAIAGADIISFGAHPFAAVRQKLELQANGPHRGATSKNLELVEFADLQCPDCKMAAPTMDRLATDFPNARIVFEYFPLTTIHPEAEKAAQYGACVAQQRG
ncbi:MAG: disulfide bond formation protein DsbA, partial [Acidobacteriaceae bacterium]